LVCVLNTDATAISLPDGEVLASSGALSNGKLPPNTAAWLG
jgi:alpha-glucosidase